MERQRKTQLTAAAAHNGIPSRLKNQISDKRVAAAVWCSVSKLDGGGARIIAARILLIGWMRPLKRSQNKTALSDDSVC